MFDPRQIDTKLLIEEVPYLSMIEMQDYDWDNLGEMLNLHVQGAGPRAALKRDEWADSHLHVRPKDYWSSVKAIRRKLERQIPVPQKQSTFHPRAHNKTLSVTMGVNNPDGSPVRTNR